MKQDAQGTRKMAEQLRSLVSLRGPRYSFQHPHTGSQQSVMPVTGDMTPSSGFKGTTHEHGTHTYK